MLRIKSVNFYNSYISINGLPKEQKQEIAFVGRSNVGKSSLINDLCSKKIAHTSSTPGKTQMLNYFLVNESFYFVDLPGYGFAKTPKSTKGIWSKLVESYLETREELKAIIFLLDSRRIPNEQDKILNGWFQQIDDVKIFYVLTKVDKLSFNELRKNIQNIAKEISIDATDFISYSVLKKIGRIELLKKLELIS